MSNWVTTTNNVYINLNFVKRIFIETNSSSHPVKYIVYCEQEIRGDEIFEARYEINSFCNYQEAREYIENILKEKTSDDSDN